MLRCILRHCGVLIVRLTHQDLRALPAEHKERRQLHRRPLQRLVRNVF